MSTNLTVERGGRTYGKRQNVLRAIAAHRNRSPGGVSVDAYGEFGAFGRAETLLEDLVRFGGLELAQRQVNRFIALVANRPAKPLTVNLLLDGVEADAAEDVARFKMQAALSDADPSNDEPARREFLRKAERARAMLDELVAAVAAGLAK